MSGEIKYYSKKKGFGIITSDSVDYFFRYTDIVGKKHKDCIKGEKVSFVPQPHTRGLRAVEVMSV